MLNVALIINCIISIATVVSAIIGLVKPQAFSHSRHVVEGEVFYVQMYAARAVPLGLLAGALPFWERGLPVALILFLAAIVQAVDIAIAVPRKEWGMVGGAAAGTIVHAVCAFMIL